MKKFLNYAYGIIGTLLLLGGFLFVLASIANNDKDSGWMLACGLSSIVSGVCLWGFSYIVDAAMVYIGRHTKEGEK